MRKPFGDCRHAAGYAGAGEYQSAAFDRTTQGNPEGIDNLLNAIQQGIFTKSTKGRLEELEAAKEELEIKIANEKIAKPKLTEEQILSYLHKFRVLDMSKQSHRQRLIDTFINRIYLYDDKLIITFNHKDGAETITLNDVGTALTEQEDGSDLVSSACTKFRDIPQGMSQTFTSEGTRKGGGCVAAVKIVRWAVFGLWESLSNFRRVP